jgi:hypothetical protein
MALRPSLSGRQGVNSAPQRRRSSVEGGSTYVVVGETWKLPSGPVGQLAGPKPRDKSPPLGGRATLQAVTRVKPEQASKVKLWMPTRLLTGEGRANGEETDKHLFGPPGYWAQHARKVIWVIGGDPGWWR